MLEQGPRSKILSGGAQVGGGGGGGGGAEACYPGKIRVSVTYFQISEGGFKINKQCIKAQYFLQLETARVRKQKWC